MDKDHMFLFRKSSHYRFAQWFMKQNVHLVVLRKVNWRALRKKAEVVQN